MFHYGSTRHVPRLVPLVLVLAATIPPASVAAQCPESTVLCRGEDSHGVEQFNETQTSTAAVNAVSHAASSASCDLVAGTVNVAAYVDDVWEHYSAATAVDEFEIHNAVAAVFTVRLALSLDMTTDPSMRMAWVAAWARLTAGDQTAETVTNNPGMAAYIEVTVVAAEGVPFTVTYETSADGMGYYPTCSLGGRLEFVGLPEGAWVTSCNGYNSSSVATEETSWGAVKARYRR